MPSTALRLAKFFGTTAGFWMNLQLRWDLYFTEKEEAATIRSIQRSRLVEAESEGQ